MIGIAPMARRSRLESHQEEQEAGEDGKNECTTPAPQTHHARPAHDMSFAAEISGRDRDPARKGAAPVGMVSCPAEEVSPEGSAATHCHHASVLRENIRFIH